MSPSQVPRWPKKQSWSTAREVRRPKACEACEGRGPTRDNANSQQNRTRDCRMGWHHLCYRENIAYKILANFLTSYN